MGFALMRLATLFTPPAATAIRRPNVATSNSLTANARFGDVAQSADRLDLSGLIHSNDVKISWSDNNSPAHPEVLKELNQVYSVLHSTGKGLPAYEQDVVTQQTKSQVLQKVFDLPGPSYASFVPSGSGASLIGMKEVVKTLQRPVVLCSEVSHIGLKQAGVLGAYLGVIPKMVATDAKTGKINAQGLIATLDTKRQVPADYEAYFRKHNGVLNKNGATHQGFMLTITQPTENGALYAPKEIQLLSKICHAFGVALHVDGARYPYAVASQLASYNDKMADDMLFRTDAEKAAWQRDVKERPLKAFSSGLGVDVMTVGMSKCGGKFGNILLFFNPEVVPPERRRETALEHYAKNSISLMDKSWEMSVQAKALYDGTLWQRVAEAGNHNAQHLKAQVEKLAESDPRVSIAAPVETNEVLVRVPNHVVAPLRDKYEFYHWGKDGPQNSLIRMMCTYQHTPQAIEGFITDLKAALDTKGPQ